jgi:hypothetical protein
MSGIAESEVRAVLEQLTDPTFAGEFTDLLALRAVETDEGLDPAERQVGGWKAAALLGDLVGAVAAELGAREQVAA